MKKRGAGESHHRSAHTHTEADVSHNYDLVSMPLKVYDKSGSLFGCPSNTLYQRAAPPSGLKTLLLINGDGAREI